jgi:diaminopimelate decarboxylase
VSLAEIGRTTLTPVYVYDARSLRETCQSFARGFQSHPHTIHYALKANSTLPLVRLLRRLGCGADANSGGEIEVALRAGYLPSQIIFTGVGKTDDELDRAITLGVAAINAESEGELRRIDAISRSRGTRTRVAVRMNPDIDARSHPHISTALATSKFGVPIADVRDLYRRARACESLVLAGLHVHVGSQILELGPLERAARTAVALARDLKDDGIELEHLDLGGGLGVSYDGRPAPSADEYAAAILPVIRDSGLHLVLEPGRVLVAGAGVLLARVVDLKDAPNGKHLAVLDAGMTELIRPAMYGAYHRIEPVTLSGGDATTYDFVGPICESSDVMGRDRTMPALSPGDLVAVLDTGAYGSVMASNYNRRLMPPEVLIEEGSWRIIRRRQTIDDLLALEE